MSYELAEGVTLQRIILPPGEDGTVDLFNIAPCESVRLA